MSTVKGFDELIRAECQGFATYPSTLRFFPLDMIGLPYRPPALLTLRTV